MKRPDWLRRAGVPERFPGPLRDWLSPRRKRFWLIVAGVTYTLAGFLLAPWITQRIVVDQLGTLLQRPVTLEAVRINPYVLSLEARGFAIRDTDGSPLARFDRLFVNFQLSSLFRWAWTFREITLEAPVMELQRFADGRINLAALVPEAPAAPEPPSNDEAGPVRLVLSEINVIQGRINFTDHVPETTFHLPVGPIDISIRSISTLPEDEGHQQVAVATEPGARIAWEGSLQLEPLQSAGRLTASGPYVPVLYRYFQDQVTVHAEHGEAELALDYQVALGDDGFTARVRDLGLAVRDVVISQDDVEVLRIPQLALEGGWLEYPELRAGAARYRLAGASMQLWRSTDGTLSVQQMARTRPSATPPAPAPPGPPDVEPPAAEPSPEEAQPQTSGEPGSPLDDWSLSLEALVVEDLAVRLEDRSLRSPAVLTVSDLDLSLSTLSNTPGARFPLTLDLAVDRGGTLTLGGELGVLPEPVLDASLEVSDLEVAAVQPYLGELANVTVQSGRLSSQIDLTVAADEPLGAAGQLRFAELAVADDVRGEQLLGWQEIGVDRFEFSTAGNTLAVSDVLIRAPYARLRIAEDGTTNFERLLVEDNGATPLPADAGAAATSSAPTVTVGRVRVEDGSADFADLSLPLPFRSRIEDLGGELSTLDTASQTPSQVRLEGQVADYGLARIQGTLLPLGPTENTDVSVLFRNVELPDLTPYTIRFAGREIDDGRMELNLRYRVENGRMVGSNKLVISDLRLGDRVEHPDALDLPLGLAVALLKGPDGTIDLDVPVEGDVDDPQFSIGGVIARALANVITNLVTSPFRLLGSLVGVKSEHFDRLEFEPGSAELTPPERGKIAKLVEALNLRPQLNLRIPPVVDPEADQAALKVLRTDARIEALLAEQVPEADQSSMYAQRRAAAVESLFRGDFPGADLEAIRAQFRKPEDPARPDGPTTLDETAFTAELRDRLIEASTVPDDALAALAAERAASVASALTDDSGLQPTRYQVMEQRSVQITDGGWIPMKMNVAAGAGR